MFLVLFFASEMKGGKLEGGTVQSDTKYERVTKNIDGVTPESWGTLYFSILAF